MAGEVGKMYRLSVIIPVYNVGEWLAACLESIRVSAGQRFDELQILLINDGSTDDSGALCDGFAGAYENVTVIHKENGGVASARNRGLDAATGQYIAWVDPDDLVAEDWCPKIFEAMDCGAPDVIVMDSVRFGNGGEIPECYGRTPGFVDGDLFREDVIRDLRMLSGMPNKVMKAKLFAGCRFEASLRILEDYALIPKLLERMETVFYIPAYLYRYRQHEGSLLHKGGGELAFRSVQIALEREAAVSPALRPAAVSAAVMQMFRFCWNQYNIPGFGGTKEQLRFCRRYLRRNIIIILRDREWKSAMKLKLLLMGFGIYGLLRSPGKHEDN